MLENKKLFLFDIDGTIAVDSTLYDGSMDLIRYIRSIGGKAIYITNNSTKSRSAYIEKFKKWHIETDESNFITASYISCLYLKEHYGKRKIYVCGTRSFVTELKEFGLNVTEENDADIACVLVGFDNELTYEKAAKTCEVLFTRETDYYATNPDLCCPTAFGSIPDCGAICKFLECAVGRAPVFLGKPSKAVVDLCLKQTGFTREETLVVGDRLYTDIACGINGNVDTAVVFTGEAKEKDLADTPFAPSYAFENIRALYEAIEK